MTGFFTNRIVIITGGASGIGRALGEELARRGALVTLADINAKQVEEVAGSIANAGYKANAVTLDVSDFEAVKKVVEDTAYEYGRLDYIFNNAGIAIGGETRDCSIGDWRNVLDVNLYGVVNGVQAAYPIMVKQGFGHIVNTSSLAGLIPAAGGSPYTASKYAIVGLSNALRVEGADLGVKVSVVCPGFINTPFWQSSKLLKLDREKYIEPLPRGISPEKCASVVLRGVERNKATIVVTLLAKLLWITHRISPALILWMRKLYVKKLRKMREE